MNNLQIFSYNGNQVRTVEVNGETWWVLKDVCRVLELSHTTDIARRLDEDEVDLIDLTDNLGRKQKTYIINESGLYSVILRSDKTEAKPFRKWVTSEVLPSIRKSGSYSTQNTTTFPPKATSAGEVSSLIKNVRIVMERQESHPRKIAKQTELLLTHFGIPVIEDFVEPAPWEQLAME